MAKTKKWEIKKLSKKQSFNKGAKIVLKNRLNAVKKSIRKYLEESSVENLHSMRIAIRRLRYGMEIFFSCFDKKKFLAFYNETVKMQDLTGEVRDLDVLYQNVSNLKESNEIDLPFQVNEEILKRKENLKAGLDRELFNFLSSDTVKDFGKLLV